ncbi:PEP-CTERM sorting domain-containing protein [Corallococcus exercitus]|nr:PEP-CTERM sorting domain-containing protein [Corallococcus exercitus]
MAGLFFSVVGLGTSAHAQSAVIYGSLGNFDISNDTGEVCHGFEIELEGLSSQDVVTTFSTQRYGAAQIVPYATGVRVRWESPYNAATQQFAQRTLPHTVPWFPGQCYQWNAGTYQDSGCEHFGTNITRNATHVRSRWLCEDSSNPGTLVPRDPPTSVPMPTYYMAPPARPESPPELVAEVEAPEPAEAPERYGDAQWMRVFETELPREVALGELMADNPAVVPMNLAQLESEYEIVQDEPASSGDGNRRRRRHQKAVAPTTRSVIRRIEMYAYTGAYDAVTHEALCADGLCNAPSAGEVGALLSVQMSAANVQPDAVLLTKPTNGKINSTDRLLACGSKCEQSYTAGQVVTLTAEPDSGSTLTGWTGACNGTALSCTVTVNGQIKVGATFSVKSGGGKGGK